MIWAVVMFSKWYIYSSTNVVRISTQITLYLLNCIKDQSKDDKLKLAFNQFDEEESRVIPFVELKRILQANYFASSTEVVEKKAGMILQQAKNTSG